MPASHFLQSSLPAFLVAFALILPAPAVMADGKGGGRHGKAHAPRAARVHRTPIRRSLPRVAPRAVRPPRAQAPRSIPRARSKAARTPMRSRLPGARQQVPGRRLGTPAVAPAVRPNRPAAGPSRTRSPKLPARASSRPNFLERHRPAGVNRSLRNQAAHRTERRHEADGRREPRADRSSFSRLRRLSTRDIERIPTGDGTLSRLRLGDRPAARRPRNTFFHRHSPTVVHDERRDRFYRITPEGNLRRITNPTVIETLRRREASRGSRKHDGDGRRWRAVPPVAGQAGPKRAAHARASHRADRHPKHHDRDDDHFYFGLSVGRFYYPYAYPYTGFRIGYHRGYYPHYVPYDYHHYPAWGWYYDPFAYGYYGGYAHFDDHWAVSIGVGIGTYAPLWCVPVLAPAPVVFWPYVLGAVSYYDYNVYNVITLPSGATYRVDGAPVASTQQQQQQQQQQAAPPPAPETQPSAAEPPPAPSPDRELLDEFATLAEEAFQRGDYEKAARFWRHALVEDPQNGLLFLLMGQALFATGKYREAAGAVQAGLALLEEKDWGVVVSNWRDLYGKPEDYTKHLRALEKAIQENPNDPALRFLVGYHYGFLGYPKEAARELGYLKELAPKDRIGLRLLEIMQARAEGKEPPKQPEGDKSSPPATNAAPKESSGAQSSEEKTS